MSSIVSARQIVVSGPDDSLSIGQAVLIAVNGDELIIKPGSYQENTIVIDKAIKILGNGYPIIDGQGRHSVIVVKADGVTIDGLEIINSGESFTEDRAGIRLDRVKNCVIENSRFDNNCFAVYLSKVGSCRVSNNVIISHGKSQTTSGNGIHLWNCRGITIQSNTIEGHRDGIYLEFARNCLIRNNIAVGNLRYGLHFMFSDSCVYQENTFTKNGAGVAVMYSNNVQMQANQFAFNRGDASYGLLLKDITESQIRGNAFTNNTVGIYAENSSRSQIEGNLFKSNGWAVRLMANCMETRFSHNRFIENSFDIATNSRKNYNDFANNYWSGYKGYDLDKDGVGDVPYRPVRLFAYVVEKYPFMLVLLRSPFVDLIDMAEKIAPVLSPHLLIDEKPMMRPPG